MALTFHKMHGAGNDFVLLDLRHQSFDLDARSATALADRRTGVGCDQVLALYPPDDPDVLARIEIRNADGSRAEQCGNGVRCIGLYLKMSGETGDGDFVIQGPVARITLSCLSDEQVRVDMGAPIFEPQRIPIDLEPSDGLYRIMVEGREIRLTALSMGNPHAVIQVEDVDTAPVTALGAAIARHPAFPQSCNVGFAQVLDPGRMRLRVFERGSGETRACGSGACAAAVALRSRGLVDDRTHVIQAGGMLIIQWPGDGEPVQMTGPAVHVFEGTMR